MSRFALVGRCSVCKATSGPGKACCGLPVVVVVAPEAPKRAGFGRGPRGRINPINKPRREKLRMAAFGPCANMARLLPCCVPSCRQKPPSDPAHVVSRGAGGKDHANVVSLCRLHHNQAHALGVETFQARHGLSLEVVAGRLAELVAAHECTSWPEVSKDGSACAVCGKRLPDDATRTP